MSAVRSFTLPRELWEQRELIGRLSLNDFKKRYAGSYMGIVWAMIQPIVTVLMYWFVFERLMGVKLQMLGEGVDVPYVLFLMGGLVPWFFLQEALMNGTTSLMEYDYLVKKVLFKVSILPLIKIMAAAIIHGFFVVVLLVVAAVAGYPPTLYTLQLPYFFVCAFVLVLAVCYTTCSVVVFFRDLTQLIAIALQLLQWATPILWEAGRLQGRLRLLVTLNPLTYIVEGYRGAIYGHRWFWQDMGATCYFWIVTLCLFTLGTVVFKRTKPMFADVL